MKRKKIGVFWFTNDLRIHDNPALVHASQSVDQLLCVYLLDYPWRSSSFYNQAQAGVNPRSFLDESLTDLVASLKSMGQNLLVLESNSAQFFNGIFAQYAISHVFRSVNVGWYENRAWDELEAGNTHIEFSSVDSHTLFDLSTLPFDLVDLPKSFTQFKNAAKGIEFVNTAPMLESLPPMPKPSGMPSRASSVDSPKILETDCELASSVIIYDSMNTSTGAAAVNSFRGGESCGLSHLHDYFSSRKPQSYKEVRNSIDGWENSCKLSPWLANGSLSVRTVATTLADYEKHTMANDSTYWIYFELLWREYFQWYAHKHGVELFSLAGIKHKKPLTSFYPERFKKWVFGSTPYPLVNACMRELLETGYLSNRGRQIVASCFVNELAMDWRYGAAYFEQALIDYDVAANWGNWQYLAGVGADTREKRHFNLAKQTQQFDPDRRYIRQWKADQDLRPLDSVDAADWPIA